VAVAFRREIEASPDPERRRAELEEARAGRRDPFPRAEGFSVHDLVDDLPFSVEDLSDPSARVPWDPFTVFLERAADALGGPEHLEEAGVAHWQNPTTALMQALATRFMSMRVVYQLGARWYGPSFFSSTRGVCEKLSGGRIEQTVEILPHYRDCPAFFHLLRGVLRATPSVLSLPNAVVSMELEPRRATYVITPPVLFSWWERLRFWRSDTSILESALQELSFQQAQLEDSFRRAEQARARLAEQSRRLQEESAERRRAEEALQEAQKLEVVGRLAGGLAHDCNNVLMAISGYAELAGTNLDDQEAVARDLEQIGSEIERASGLIKQILAFSRRQLRAPRPLDLAAVLRDTERMLGRLAGEAVALRIDVGAETAVVVADTGQIEQVLINLVTNSRDAMPRGGHVAIRLELVEVGPADPIAPPDAAPGPYVRLSVRDDGAGMDPAIRARAFEPFVTGKGSGQGTGLGLTSVYGIAKQSGGAVTLASEPGKGTEVAIYLPRAEEAVEAAEPSTPAVDLEARGELVLLVEDEDRVRGVMRRILGSRGYRVWEAADGAEALALCSSQPEPIDLLLTDVVMPGLDGRELARRVAASRPGIPTIYMSGHADALPGRSELPAGEIFLRKPIPTDRLLRAVRRALDGRGS